MELNKVLSMVNGLTAKAEHPDTEPNEAQACRERAYSLMLKYAIDEATAEAARPASERTKPEVMSFPVGEYGDIIGHIAGLMGTMARHCRCLIKHYTHTALDENGRYQYYSKVYGYASDLRYFEILWTTTRLHMLSALVPGISRHESEDDNAYRLHNAGYNWLEIAGLYGWRKQTWSDHIRHEHERGLISDEMYEKYQDGKAEIWYNEETDEYKTNWQLGSGIKRSYHRAIKARGEKPTKISASGGTTYRKSAAEGYHSMIATRLARMRRENVGGSSALVLRSDALEDYYREDNASGYKRCPRCGKLSSNPYECEFCGQFIQDRPDEKEDKRHRRTRYQDRPFNQRAYNFGLAHAKSADLMAGERVSSPAPKPIS